MNEKEKHMEEFMVQNIGEDPLYFVGDSAFLNGKVILPKETVYVDLHNKTDPSSGVFLVSRKGNVDVKITETRLEEQE